MAKKSTRAWTQEEQEQVIAILTSFSGADEVCAVMECDPADLDRRCYQAFNAPFADVMERYHTVGRAKIRQALFDGAMNGNAKALDTLSREQLGTGPVETRKRVTGSIVSKQEEVDF